VEANQKLMTADREPFGDCLYDGITDLDHHIRKTIVAAREGIDVRKYRAASAAARFNDYRGGPVHWDSRQMAEAA
jgi:hypothetical protein